MIIEIVGVDGSGKTTAIHTARKLINEAGVAFAYERPFQSEHVRMLEAAASTKKRARPFSVYGRETVEITRTLELVEKSYGLTTYKGSVTQHVFCDSYIVEQAARILQYNLDVEKFIPLIDMVLKPDASIYLNVSVEEAICRIRNREKGDAILLEASPELAVKEIIKGQLDALSLLKIEHKNVDANQTAGAVVKDIMNYLEQKISVLKK